MQIMIVNMILWNSNNIGQSQINFYLFEDIFLSQNSAGKWYEQIFFQTCYIINNNNIWEIDVA